MRESPTGLFFGERIILEFLCREPLSMIDQLMQCTRQETAEDVDTPEPTEDP